jgi:hypothetical protein
MLTAYQQQTRLLLNDPTFIRFNDFDFQTWINTARGQIAGESECIRVYATLAVTAAVQQYPFSAIVFPTGSVGIQGVINVRSVMLALGSGQTGVTAREWSYFRRNNLSTPTPVAEQPNIWAQLGQGANGTIWINLPDIDYTLTLDTVCFPTVLNTDADPEALPYLWTDAVPYFTAYLAYLAAQDKERADAMLQLYQTFVGRARQFATPSVLPHQYAQGPDPVMASRLGVTQPVGRG